MSSAWLQEWVGANFTPADKRTPEQIAKLSTSSALVAELKDADVVVQPSQVGLKSADFSARQRAIDAGRAAMRAALPALRAKMDTLRAAAR